MGKRDRSARRFDHRTALRRGRPALSTPAIGLCIVGPGAIAGEHARAMSAIPGLENRVVVGASEEEARAFAGEWDFSRSTASLGRALGDKGVTLVLVASPNPLHCSQAEMALVADKDVAVEVPLAMTEGECRRLIALAAERGRRLFVCSTMRSYPGVRALRQIVSDGEAPSQLVALCSTPRRHNEHWVGGRRSWVDNILWHHGWHFADTALWVLGQPPLKEISAFAGVENPDFGMTMDLAITFETTSSTLCSLNLTYNSAHPLEQVWLATSGEHYVLDDTELRTVDGQTVEPGRRWSDLGEQDRDIVSALRAGTPSIFDGRTFLPTIELLGNAQQRSGVR